MVSAPAAAASDRLGHLFCQTLASEGLLAFIAPAKFCDALPMSDAGACEPLMELLLEQLRSGPKLQIDETTVQVLKEPDRDYVRRPA